MLARECWCRERKTKGVMGLRNFAEGNEGNEEEGAAGGKGTLGTSLRNGRNSPARRPRSQGNGSAPPSRVAAPQVTAEAARPVRPPSACPQSASSELLPPIEVPPRPPRRAFARIPFTASPGRPSRIVALGPLRLSASNPKR